MNNSEKPPVLVVVQLTGGNDFMNTVVPYTNGTYQDARPRIRIEAEQVLPIDGTLGLHPSLGPLKEMYDQGDVAVIQGVGYPNSSRSHFRSMDIWHTSEPEKIADEGWLGKVIRELDPDRENVLTGINFGRGLPRAMSGKGVPVASVGDLDKYGLMTGMDGGGERVAALSMFESIYSPSIGTGPVMEYLANTGRDVLNGADVLKTVPAMYSSTVEYADNPIARRLRDVARVHLADLGTRVFYVQHGDGNGYDSHSRELENHANLLTDLSRAISDFFADLREHEASDKVLMLVFSEFGRRVADNGSGTDHGSAGGAFLIGDRVNGGLHAEYSSLDPADFDQGEDLAHTVDFRTVYTTILERWLELEARPIVGGSFEQLDAIPA